LATFLNCVFVGLGGLVGSVLRYLVSLVPLRHESGFPLVTLGINVFGAFLLGLLVAASGRTVGLDPRAELFLKVGLCGGFTTFSIFALEAHTLLSGGKPTTGLPLHAPERGALRLCGIRRRTRRSVKTQIRRIPSGRRAGFYCPPNILKYIQARWKDA
jgi:CrcB protein